MNELFPRQLHHHSIISLTQMLTQIAANKAVNYVGNLTIDANRRIALKDKLPIHFRSLGIYVNRALKKRHVFQTAKQNA